MTHGLSRQRVWISTQRQYAQLLRINVAFVAYCCAFTFSDAVAADEETKVNFANDIQTVLARRCYACHGPDLQEGNIRFDDRESLLGEADSGEIPIVVGDANKSELIRRITSTEEYDQMPPEGKRLTEEEVDAFRRWIDGGAEYEKHWAFQPVQDPTPPSVNNDNWPQSPLDRFVLSRLESAGLSPAPEARPAELIRRLYLDITGLPPQPEIVKRLAKDWDNTTYEELVDELLSQPSFGERWARVWLDVVRYAETNSFERDNPKPNAFKYRDYVVRAMNEDKAYDRFIREQIAGDELDETSDDSLTATGYYRLGLWDDEPADPKQALFDGFDDLVTTTGQGMLGLTFNCARCHDHKIDPITQKDYYSLVAFMRDVTPYGTRRDQTTNNQVDLDPDIADQHRDLNARRRELNEKARKIEQEAIKKMDGPDQRATEGRRRAKTLKEKLHLFVDQETFATYSDMKAEIAEIARKLSELPPRRTVLGLGKVDTDPPDTHILARGSPHAEGDVAEPVFPKLLGGGIPEFTAQNENSAGRRRALADWIASDENWMTPRVIVNRIWLHYFGRGIVRSPNNFGLMGDAPTHPLLIDYLATKLVQGDWHLKSIHRAILLSSTYRMSTQANGTALAQDPDNNLFWRQNLKRLSAEQVRDSVLAVTGELNRQLQGPSMYPRLSQEVLASQSKPGNGWGNSPASEQARRSIYIHVKRSLPVPLLTAFDFPDTDISCEARFLTTQPGQALTLLNSDWMQQQSAKLLARVQREAGSDTASLASRALELCTGMAPDEENVKELVELVERLTNDHGLSQPDARKAMCLVALNLNQFLYIQ